MIKDMTGMIVDTPKAHLGSNLAFAQSLKNNLVSIGYVDVQDWSVVLTYCTHMEYGLYLARPKGQLDPGSGLKLHISAIICLSYAHFYSN